MNIVKVEEKFSSSIDKVWDYMTNLDNQTWRNNVDHIDIINYHNYIEYDKNGEKTEYIILNKLENELYEFNMKSHQFDGHWIGELKELEDGSIQLNITEAIQLKKKQMNFIGQSHLKKHLSEYVHDLKKALNE